MDYDDMTARDEARRQARLARCGFGYELRAVANEYADKPMEDEIIDELMSDLIALRRLENYAKHMNKKEKENGKSV